MRRKLRKFKEKLNAGIMTIEDIKASFNSWLGYAKKTKSFKTKQSMGELFYKLFGIKLEVKAYVV